MMRKVYWSLGLSLMMLCGSPSLAEDAGTKDPARMAKLEKMLEIAVDRFQLNRYIEARAELNRLIVENPTCEEAFALRKIFGEKILLEMQRFGDRPTLSGSERKVLQLLGDATYAMDRSRLDKAAERLEEIVKTYETADIAPAAKGSGQSDSAQSSESFFELNYAKEMLSEIKKLDAADTAGVREYADKLHRWREQLQSVGNVPLVLLSRAQRHEQDVLRSPEQIRLVVNHALNTVNAQRNMLEIVRLGVYAVPDLLNGLRNEKSDLRRTNAHFILLTLGNRIILPLCEALKSDDQLFLQQLCAVIGEMRPADNRAIPYLKAVYDNPKNLASTIDAAGAVLRSITGEDPKNLLPAADYFLMAANRYYIGGNVVDQELREAKNTFWVWDPEMGDGKGELRELPVPSFAIGDLMAEEMVYRGMASAADKTPFQVLLASIFLQQKNRVDTLNKLLIREDLSHPEMGKLRSDALDWGKRLERNQRIVYTLGTGYLAGVLEKAMRDHKIEVAVNAMEAIAVVAGKNGWEKMSSDYVPSVVKTGSGSSGDAGETSANDGNDDAVKVVEPAVSASLLPANEGAEQKKNQGVAQVKTSATPAADATAKTAVAVNPLLAALDSDSPRIAVAAANTLVNIGLPATHAAYRKLLPLLLEGAQENRATVVEVITGNNDLRRRLANELEKGQMVAQVASDGYAGYSLAIQYPPKDVLLVDNRLDQFNTLRLQMSLREISQNRVLPLTIITTQDHVASIAAQFTKNAIEKEATRRHTDPENILTKENNMFTDDNWRVVVRHNIKVDNKNIFEGLQAVMKFDQKQAVVILTNPSRTERFKLKDELLLKAERSLRPNSLSEYANLRNKDKVLGKMGDIFGVRVTYSPVFVDEEISGYDTMKTVQALLTDPRTRSVPIGIMADNSDIKNVRADFERFIKDNLVEVINRDINANELLDKVGEMKKRNKLSEKNYARALSNDIATRSAKALAELDRTALGRSLTPDEEKRLFAVVSDGNRPVELRIAASRALGHFTAKSTLKSLMTLFSDVDRKEIALRAAIMRAIGEIDIDNSELDFKLAAMGESDIEVQREAARALGPAAQNQEQLKKYMDKLRPNDPLALVRSAKTAAPATNDVKADDDAQAKDGEEKAETADDKDADAESEKAETKDDKGSDDNEFNW